MHPLDGLDMSELKKAYEDAKAATLCSVNGQGVRERRAVRKLLEQVESQLLGRSARREELAAATPSI